MSAVDRWLLPDGIGDILPGEARRIELLRRRLLDVYHAWGYELVMPPLIEFTESLLVGAHRDLDLQTFKVTDQLSGRLMGLRADVTPQAARIDAHGLNREGPVRLCYAETVLHTRPANALASRAPLQVGVECFGIADALADVEVISLMAETLALAGVEPVVISLGHAGVFGSIVRATGLGESGLAELHDILERKAGHEIGAFARRNQLPGETERTLHWLVGMQGDASILAAACPDGLPAEVANALAGLAGIATCLASRYPRVSVQVDLAGVPGYHYHNGIVFAAYARAAGAAVANGGRYDTVGETYGRFRPATGFNADLKTLARLSTAAWPDADAILVRQLAEPSQWEAVCQLRAAGERVIALAAHESASAAALGCTRELVTENGRWVVRPSRKQ